MEKITLDQKKNFKNESLGNNNFKVFSEEIEYNFKINTNLDQVTLTVCKEDSMENFEKTFTFEEISSTQCFKMEEDIEEIKSVMMQYILEDKITLSPNEDGIEAIFETQFNLKKLKSVFQLNKQEEDIQNAVKFLKIKMNHLINENKNKDTLIKEIQKTNEDNLKSINYITNEVEKMKEIQERQENLIKELKENKSAPPTFNASNNAGKNLPIKKHSVAPAGKKSKIKINFPKFLKLF